MSESGSGPDLARDGVDLASLTEHTPLLGHANDEPVIVVWSGDALYAVGAMCSHYGGPLDKGLVVADDRGNGPTIRCPWHHACFSLRSGEALCAPALSPIPRWVVESRDGRAYVRDRSLAADAIAQTAGHAPRADSAQDRRTFVIVGGGAAGEAAAEMLRRHGFSGRIVIVERSTDLPVDRPMLSKNYLAGNAADDAVPLRPRGFFAEHDVELRLGVDVEQLDPDAHTVTLAGGETLSYDRLLLAPGADPVRLDIPGADLPHVHLLRSWSDARRLVDAATRAAPTGRPAVVVGASFIGLEVAASLRTRGVAVHVVAPEQRPLEKVLGAAIGDAVRGWHEAHGVTFHLGAKPARIATDAVVLEDGTRLPASLVVVGVGVRPNVELAERAGLAADRGIVVDTHLATSAPDVYAAGDVARWPDPHTGERIRVEHWVVAQRQGQVAARAMLGHDVVYDDVPFFWSAHYGTSIRYVGHAERPERADVDGDPSAKDVTVTYRSEARTLAVATIGRDTVALEAERQLEQR